jgi:hypothetical protein
MKPRIPQRNYEESLSQRIREIGKLLAQRDAINVNLVELLASVRALSSLVGEAGRDEEYVRDLDYRIRQPAGLTDGVRFVLRTSPKPLRPVQKREILENRGYDLRKYSFPMGVIHAILKKLAKRGEIHVITDPDSTKLYSHRPPTRPGI